MAGSILSHGPATALRSAALGGEAAKASQVTKLPWPDIDGIDTADACARWCGDVPLFIAMLSRLLDEFDAIRFPADIEVPADNTPFVRQMHKLRGGACMLGAKTVYALAGQMEAAALHAGMPPTAELRGRLSNEMLLVSNSARPVIAAERARADDLLLAGAAPIAPSLFKELNVMLRRQSLAAVDSFKSLSPQIRHCMGQAVYERVRLHIDNLQFEEASNLLESSQQQLPRRRAATGFL
jgi:HPt (histidine-containing phosphotransfer) domain-containing protein